MRSRPELFKLLAWASVLLALAIVHRLLTDIIPGVAVPCNLA
jgi:hypothetical protein